jgi:hypothetical protein
MQETINYINGKYSVYSVGVEGIINCPLKAYRNDLITWLLLVDIVNNIQTP